MSTDFPTAPVGSSQAPTAAVEKSLSASHTKIRTLLNPLFRYAPQAIPPPRTQQQQPRQKQTRRSVVQLQMKSHAQLKLGRILS